MLVTRPMRLMPPRITSATIVEVVRPVIHVAIPNSASIASATVLAWFAFPVMNAVIPSMTAKNAATGFQRGPSPFSM